MVHKSSSNCVKWDINPIDDGTGTYEISVSNSGCSYGGEVKTAKLAMYGTNRDSSSTWAYVCRRACQCTSWNIRPTNEFQDGQYILTPADNCEYVSVAGRALAAHKKK